MNKKWYRIVFEYAVVIWGFLCFAGLIYGPVHEVRTGVKIFWPMIPTVLTLAIGIIYGIRRAVFGEND
jgi:hypothetical protein